jgi:hypothetical protein
MKTNRIAITILCLAFALLSPLSVGAHADPETNQIHFEKSDYGLIFTSIQVNGEEVRAMIDFGDPHKLQLSSTLVERLEIEGKKTNYQISDIHGNLYDVYRGEIPELRVGSRSEQNVEFTYQVGEMEAVSRQIGTEFHAVLGWGTFRDSFTEIDYRNGVLTLSQNPPPSRNGDFRVPFRRDANQLLVPARINGEKQNLMIDTGSPVTVVDSNRNLTTPDGLLRFQLAEKELKLKAYSQDLSVLADLGVAGILGGDFLQQWIVTIDPEKSVLLFSRVTD